MSLFSKKYVPGGVHHVRITDHSFQEALEAVRTDPEVKQVYHDLCQGYDVLKHEAHDFPVTEIVGAFMLSYQLQEEAAGVPENLQVRNVKLGHKDKIEYEKFVDSYNASIDAEVERKNEAWDSKGMGGKLFSLAAQAAAKGIAKAATGKSEDIRFFEKTFANYLCGDSKQAKSYLLNFAVEFGGDDEGLIDVVKILRENFWVSEFAKYNRSR